MQYNTINFNSNPIYKVFMNNNMSMNMNNNMSMSMSMNMNMNNSNTMKSNKNNYSLNNNNRNIGMPQNYNLNPNMQMNNMYNINNQMNNNNNNIQWKNNLNNTMNNNMLNNNYLDYLNNTWKLYLMFNEMNKANTQKASNKIKFINFNSPNNINRLMVRQNSSPNYDDFPGYTGKRFNIVFHTPSGVRINIQCPVNVKLKDLFLKFYSRLGLGQDVINSNSIFFLYNGSKLNNDENRTIEKMGINNYSSIIAIDTKNLLGA